MVLRVFFLLQCSPVSLVLQFLGIYPWIAAPRTGEPACCYPHWLKVTLPVPRPDN